MSRAVVCLVAVALSAGCGRIDFEPVTEQPLRPEGLCFDGWCWELPLPQGEPINAIHGTGPDDVWAVGARGLVMHYDGTTWSFDRPPGSSEEYLNGVYASPGMRRIVGSNGLVASYDGTTWSESFVGDETGEGVPWFTSLWGASPDNLWAGSYVRVVARFDGSQWTQQVLPTGVSTYVLSIWGTAADDIWFAGDNLTLHWDGGSFQSGAPTGVDASVWGASATDVWLSDVNSQLFHFDGAGWTTINPTTAFVTTKMGWSSSAGQAWISDWDGYLYRASSSTREITEAAWPSHDTLNTFWGTGADAWAGGDGGRLYHWDGGSWAPYFAPGLPRLVAIDGTSADNAWAVGWHGTVVRRGPGGWEVIERFTTDNLVDVAVVAADNVWVASYQTIYHWDGTAWTDVYTRASVSIQELAASGPSDVWMKLTTTPGGINEVLHFDGSGWNTVDLGVAGNTSTIFSAGPEDLWTHVDNHVLHYENGVFVQRFDLSAVASVRSFHGTSTDLWVVGSDQIYHWDGTSLITYPNASVIQPFMLVERGDDVLAAGLPDGVIQLDDTMFVPHSNPTSNRLEDMWTDGENVWVVGWGGSILRL